MKFNNEYLDYWGTVFVAGRLLEQESNGNRTGTPTHDQRLADEDPHP